MRAQVQSAYRGFDEGLSQFGVLVSYRFQRHIMDIDKQKREAIYGCIMDLISGWEQWRHRQVKKPQRIPPNRKVRTARISEKDRLVFEGPLRSDTSEKPVLFVHDFCNHDELPRVIGRVLKQEVRKEDFSEPDFWPTKDEEQEASLHDIGAELVAFAKPIRPLAFADPQTIDRILKSEKANLHLTKKQLNVLDSQRPLLINGQAGTGKTTILCHRLALSIIQQREQGTQGRMLYLSYSRRLVDQAKKDVQEILRDLHLEDDNVEYVDFIPFQEFIKRYVSNPSRFKESSYVSFGRFKRYYEIYRRGNRAARRIPSEVAWHVIRSIMKGACMPQFDEQGGLLHESRPPLSEERYLDLSRRRREVDEDLYEDIYGIGSWYQEKIREENLWDDQDLAWEALSSIMEEQRNNPNMPLYLEIFCDEVQDLTEIEFAILVSLCRPPVPYAREGPFIALAGDPLQTINPTGFRWEVVSAHVYNVGNKPVQRYELEENWRSDKRIVELANKIQSIRAYYLGQELRPQQAFVKEGVGDFPHIVYLETKDEANAVREELRTLPSHSAIVLWPEEDEELLELISEDDVLKELAKTKLSEYSSQAELNDEERRTIERFLSYIEQGEMREIQPEEWDSTKKILDKLMADLDLYQVSDAKGLEFRLVILYKFGEHSEVRRWWNYMPADTHPGQHEEIPLLYFLNRLYVSVTRPQSYLFIVDTPDAVKGFWNNWENLLRKVDRANVRDELNTHVAFREFVRPSDWRVWGDALFEKAERNQDIRDYERAKAAYHKAGEEQKAKKVEARMAELYEHWEKAGDLYSKIDDYANAAKCYENAQKWGKAVQAYCEIPSWSAIPEIRRRVKICQFRDGCTQPKRKEEAALQFLKYVDSDTEIEKEYIRELANVLEEVKEYEHTAKLCERLYKEHQDTQAGIRAGKCWHEAEIHDKALEMFKSCGYYGTEYMKSGQAQADALREQGDYYRAAGIYEELGRRGRKDAYAQQGICLYNLKRYRDALDAFDKGGYEGKEYDLCRAEIQLEEGEIKEAVELLGKYGEHERILVLAEGRGKSEITEIIPQVAEAYFQVCRYNEALKLFNDLARQARRDRNFSDLNRYLTKIGDCQYELGQKEDAYNSYKEGRAYEKAIQVAQELGKPDEVVKRLHAEAARSKRPPDFDTAIAIYEELGDVREAASVRGHKLKYQQKHLEAIEHFAEAQEWDQVLDCIEQGFFPIEQERTKAKIQLLKAASSIEGLRRDEKDKVMDWAREIREDEEWTKQISPREMGLVYERFASFVEAADFHEMYIKEQWAREGWLRVKEAQCKYHEERNEHDKAKRIRQRIQDRRREWNL